MNGRRLACPVRSQETVNLSGRKCEAHGVERSFLPHEETIAKVLSEVFGDELCGAHDGFFPPAPCGSLLSTDQSLDAPYSLYPTCASRISPFGEITYVVGNALTFHSSAILPSSSRANSAPPYRVSFRSGRTTPAASLKFTAR